MAERQQQHQQQQIVPVISSTDLLLDDTDGDDNSGYSGHFGIVRRGTLRFGKFCQKSVAVKISKENVQETSVMKEAQILR